MFEISDVFYITGRGYILTCTIPIDSDNHIFIGDTIAIDDTDESYVVIGIERFSKLIFPQIPSPNVGILIRGEIKQDKNSYRGKKIVKT